MKNGRVVIDGTVSSNAARALVSELTCSGNVCIDGAIDYPYFSFAVSCEVPTLFGRRMSQLSCLVNAVTGHGATAGRFTSRQVASGETDAVVPGISQDDAAQAARRTATHALGRNLRVIADFNLQMKAHGIVYKRFWIVRCGQTSVMVDNTNGGLHPLLHSAAPATPAAAEH